MLSRREFSTLAAMATAGFASESRYTIGITTNTRGGWEDDAFLSFREAPEVGFRWVGTFFHYFVKDYVENPQALQRRMDEIGVKFVTISNGGPLETHFEDRTRHKRLIADHMKLRRFITTFR